MSIIDKWLVIHRQDTAEATSATSTTNAKTPSNDIRITDYPMCCECGLPIDERIAAWWGGDRCHRECGEAAFRRERQAGAYLPRPRGGCADGKKPGSL
jgi:hypothetical protein